MSDDIDDNIDAPPPDPAAENERLRADLFDARMANALNALQASRDKLADPDDLARFVPRDQLVDADGQPDPARVIEAARALATTKPYLKASSPHAGTVDSGARGRWENAPISRDDLRHMTTDEITRARRDGRLDHLIGG